MDIGAGQRESRPLCAEFARDWLHMHRLSAIFIAVCMVLIAGSIGALLYLAIKLDGRTSAIAGLAVLILMMMLNMLSGRIRDRGDLGDQIADLSRGTSD